MGGPVNFAKIGEAAVLCLASPHLFHLKKLLPSFSPFAKLSSSAAFRLLTSFTLPDCSGILAAFSQPNILYKENEL